MTKQRCFQKLTDFCKWLKLFNKKKTDGQQKMNIKTVNNSSEKYKEISNGIVLQLLDFLNKANLLENEIFQKDEDIMKLKEKHGISIHQSVPEEKLLWEEFSTKYRKLLDIYCTEELINNGYAKSYGKPARYDFINTGHRIELCMKSAGMITIIFEYNEPPEKRTKFVMRQTDSVWKISSVQYNFPDEKVWHTCHI